MKDGTGSSFCKYFFGLCVLTNQFSPENGYDSGSNNRTPKKETTILQRFYTFSTGLST